jgi:hypothetical protein
MAPMRIVPLSLAVALVALVALSGCEGANSVPTTNVQDYRVTFHNTESDPVTATSSCSDVVEAQAADYTERSFIYRVHFPDGEAGLSLDMYVREEGTTEQDFAYFASGLLDGDIESGNISYAGGPYKDDDRGDGETIWYEVEGSVRTSFFGDLWDRGTEKYIITDSTDQGTYTNGCTFSIPFEGRLEGGTEPE